MSSVSSFLNSSCYDIDSNSHSSLFRQWNVGIAMSVSIFPLISFWYCFIVYFSYAFYREIHWMNTKSLHDLCLRWIIVIISWLLSIPLTMLCISCNKDNDTTTSTTTTTTTYKGCLIGSTGFVTLLFMGVSIYFIMKTRREDVVGVDPTITKTGLPIFYGSHALEGKLILVTGANSGIGKETTRQLAAQGATILMLCRGNSLRAKMAMDSIREQHQHYHLENPMKYPTPTLRKDQLLFVPIDLTDFQSIHHAVKCIQQHLELRTSTLQATVATEGLGGRIPTQYLYSVICNAGLMMGTQTTTKDGYETMMQANHLGHFLLLKLLLDNKMLKTTIVPPTPAVHDEPSRICILTSSTYEFSANENGFDFTDPFCSEGKRAYTLFGQYSMTKLANLLFAQELSKRYNNNNNNTKLSVFAVHPGIVRTNVTSNMNWYWRLGNHMFGWIVSSLSKTAEEGAYSTTYVVSAPYSSLPRCESTSSGGVGAPYIVNCQPQQPHEYITNPTGGGQDSHQLWMWSEQLVTTSTSSATTATSTSTTTKRSHGLIMSKVEEEMKEKQEQENSDDDDNDNKNDANEKKEQ